MTAKPNYKAGAMLLAGPRKKQRIMRDAVTGKFVVIKGYGKFRSQLLTVKTSGEISARADLDHMEFRLAQRRAQRKQREIDSAVEAVFKVTPPRLMDLPVDVDIAEFVRVLKVEDKVILDYLAK